jgi:hypothetical protein
MGASLHAYCLALFDMFEIVLDCLAELCLYLEANVLFWMLTIIRLKKYSTIKRQAKR